MQTFLPLPDIAESAAVLDRQRLGKQRVEAKQILLVLSGVSKGWRNHPAVRMWEGYETALAMYGFAVCQEWRSRGYKDTLLPWFEPFTVSGPVVLPGWFGWSPFHAAHRSALLAKNPKHYSQFGWTDLPRIAYVWPI